MYKVIAGKIEKECKSLNAAKKEARRFNFAQIVDQMGFVRFVVRNGRVCKI